MHLRKQLKASDDCYNGLMSKIKVAVLFGGQSAEHEVSIQSARNVLQALDADKYEVIPIAISKAGQWLSPGRSAALLNSTITPPSVTQDDYLPETILNAIHSTNIADRPIVDVVFPILHGPFGEDGTMQGLLKLAHIPFVGASVLGSAVSMDKDVAKRLLRDAGFNIAPFIVIQNWSANQVNSIIKQLNLPLFVKPANLGSSVGITKVHQAQDLDAAIKIALQYDRKVIIESEIKGREIEVAVLGNDRPQASIPGEIIPQHDFYSYEAKYLDENGALLQIPADLPGNIVTQLQDQAIKAFQTLCCQGLARVDFFFDQNNQIYINEINTIPGFTNISMYPRLWQASGLSYTQLIDKLIQLAIDRFNQEQKLTTTQSPST